MTPLSSRRFPIALLAVALILACGGGDPDSREPAPLDLRDQAADEPLLPGQAATPAEEPAPVASDPRLVLFDVRTALEAVRPTQDGYPVTDAFRHEERWRVQRERLDAAFDDWDYTSDGEAFRLRGVIGDRAWDVTGP